MRTIKEDNVNKELEQKLIKKYPKLYKQYYDDLTKTCMCWGFDCGDGWFKIIDELSEKLEKYDVEAVQVKEKFAGLRFYIGECNSDKFDEIYDLISKTEELSYEICESCGAPGKVRGTGWLKTLCDKCNKN